MLTRDLRAPSHPVVPASAVPVPQVPVAPVAPPVQYTPYVAPVRPPAPRRTGRVSTAVVAVFALAVVGVGTAVTGLFAGTVGPIGGSEGSVTVAEDPYDLSAPGLEAFLELYAERFGNTKAVNATFHEEHVSVDVPTADGRARHESWSYSGGQFRRMSEATANSPMDGVFDLRRLNLGKLAANIETARATLGVEDVDSAYCVVGRGWTVLPNRLSIHVQNEFGENAFLTTNLAGRVLSRHPFRAR